MYDALLKDGLCGFSIFSKIAGAGVVMKGGVEDCAQRMVEAMQRDYLNRLLEADDGADAGCKLFSDGYHAAVHCSESRSGMTGTVVERNAQQEVVMANEIVQRKQRSVYLVLMKDPAYSVPSTTKNPNQPLPPPHSLLCRSMSIFSTRFLTMQKLVAGTGSTGSPSG